MSSGITVDDLDALDAECEPENDRSDDESSAGPMPGYVNGSSRVAADGWEDPEPLDAVNVPSFPVESLPTWMSGWVTAEAEFTQTPVDLPASVALGVVSLGAAREYRAQVRHGWEEPLNLWTAVALNPGLRKSPVYGEATAPIFDYQDSELERLARDIKTRNRERRVIQQQIEKAESEAAKAGPGNNQGALDKASRLDDMLHGKPEIHPPNLIVEDITAEALAMRMSKSDEQAGLFSAEGGAFSLMAGRYSDGASNFELYLKAHNGDHHLVDRVKREAITLARPLLTIAMTVQPVVIAGLAEKPDFRERGLLARFLYSLPQTAIGARETDTDEVPREVSDMYHACVLRILQAHKVGNLKQQILTFALDADRARADFQTRLEPRLGEGGDLAGFVDWAAKLVGAVCRIAGVLHVADHALALENLPSAIPGATFYRAQAIGLYYLEHARAAFGLMRASPAVELAGRIWKWIHRRKLSEFSANEARSATRSTADETGAALAVMAGRHLVRERPPGPPTGGRPASPRYDVNPKVRH